jgi:tRNA U34 5-methylaminomethyl-2-thiouridine-forming methyltransferase MnmC
MSFELIVTKFGPTSLRCTKHNETFHPVTGPRVEARVLHVEQQRIQERAAASRTPFVIWDVGLGAAANAIAAIEALREGTSRVELHSFDITTAPLLFALENAAALQYPLPHVKMIRELLVQGFVEVRPGFVWRIHLGDFRELVRNVPAPAPDSIFYDPYSPRGNQEMWTLGHFTNLFARLDPAKPCLLTNYTRSTSVRVTLALAGFAVGIGAIIGEKDQTTIASNRLDWLERPLRKDWFERVSVSRNAAPFREPRAGDLAIAAEDLAALRALPQFA